MPDTAVLWPERAASEDELMAMWFHIFPPLRHLRGAAGYRRLLKNLQLSLPRP